MTTNKPQGFSLFPSSSRIIFYKNSCFLTTSTVAISVRNFHLYLQIKRLISRLMRVTAFDHYPRYSQPRHDGGIKIPSSRIRLNYMLMRKYCQEGCR
jgi:hypothetical protein